MRLRSVIPSTSRSPYLYYQLVIYKSSQSRSRYPQLFMEVSGSRPTRSSISIRGLCSVQQEQIKQLVRGVQFPHYAGRSNLLLAYEHPVYAESRGNRFAQRGEVEPACRYKACNRRSLRAYGTACGFVKQYHLSNEEWASPIGPA